MLQRLLKALVLLPSSTRVPALATDPVTSVAGPRHGVLAGRLVGVLDGAGTVGPEREVEAVVGARLAAGKGLALQRHARLLARGGDGDGSRRGSKEERREGDHFERLGVLTM